MSNGWRGFAWHLKKVLVLEHRALNLPNKHLPGSVVCANKSFAAAVVQGRRSEFITHRLAAEEHPLSQDACDNVDPHLFSLNSRMSISANLDP